MQKIVITNLAEKMRLLHEIRLRRLKKYLKENMSEYNEIWNFLKEQR